MKKNKNKKFNIKTFNNLLFLLIIVLGVYFVAGTNDLTVKGFKLKELKIEVMEVKNQNDELELNIMAKGSYSDISEKIENLNMVAVGDVDYVVDMGGIVARK